MHIYQHSNIYKLWVSHWKPQFAVETKWMGQRKDPLVQMHQSLWNLWKCYQHKTPFFPNCILNKNKRRANRVMAALRARSVYSRRDTAQFHVVCTVKNTCTITEHVICLCHPIDIFNSDTKAMKGKTVGALAWVKAGAPVQSLYTQLSQICTWGWGSSHNNALMKKKYIYQFY